MYIMRVCLFSAQSRRLGALQISIIIIKLLHVSSANPLLRMSVKTAVENVSENRCWECQWKPLLRMSVKTEISVYYF